MRDLVIRVRMDVAGSQPTVLDLALRSAMLGDSAPLLNLLGAWDAKVEAVAVGTVVSSEKPDEGVQMFLGCGAVGEQVAAVLGAWDGQVLWVVSEWVGPKEAVETGPVEMINAAGVGVGDVTSVTWSPRPLTPARPAKPARDLRYVFGHRRFGFLTRERSAHRALCEAAAAGRLRVAPSCDLVIATLNGAAGGLECVGCALRSLAQQTLPPEDRGYRVHVPESP